MKADARTLRQSRPMSRPALSIIAIVARNGGIGRGNALLWHLSEDLKHFKRTTLGCPIVMGRRTWESIGRPLPGRRNIVVTRNAAFAPAGAETAPSLEAALDLMGGTPRAFVIGGGELYAAALPLADTLVLTEVDAEAEADTFFPPWDRTRFRQTAREDHINPNGPNYSFVTYERN